jgi:hypothetical protein
MNPDTMVTDTFYRIEYQSNRIDGWREWDTYRTLDEAKKRRDELINDAYYKTRIKNGWLCRLVLVEITERLEVIE